MTKKLYKSRNDKAVSGVCAGIADYFDIDVIVVRLLAVIFCFMSFGTALVLYIIAAIVIPEEPTVRMGDGSKRPVYETTYEYRGEEGTPGSGASTVPPGGNGSANCNAGGAEFYTGGGNDSGAGMGADSGTGGQNGSQGPNSGSYQNSGQYQNGPADPYGEPAPRKKSSGTWILGILLVGMGVYMIFDWFFPWISWRIFGAVILIVLGLIVLIKK